MSGISICIFVTWMLWISVSGDATTNKMKTVEQFERGYKFQYSNSVTKYTSSRIGCATACASDDLCNSMNVKKDNGKFICEMSSEGTGFLDTANLVGDNDYRYYEKKTPCLNGGIWNATTSQCDNCHYLTWGQLCDSHSKDCEDAKTRFPDIESIAQHHVILIQPNLAPAPFLVKCDMKYNGLRWAQRSRNSGKVNFTRGWQDYKNGFGDLQKFNDDFFLGLDKLHLITNPNSWFFLIWLEFVDNNVPADSASYPDFSIADELSSYQLQFTRGWHEPGYDPEFLETNGAEFFTYDNDCSGNCAKISQSGWWFFPSAPCPEFNLHSVQGMKWKYNNIYRDLSYYEFQLKW